MSNNQITCAKVRVGPLSIGCFDRNDDCVASIRRSSIVAYRTMENDQELLVTVSLENGETYRVMLKRMLAADYFKDRKILMETDLLKDGP